MINQYFHNQYLEEGKNIPSLILPSEKAVGWSSPSNIALIKYWGKFGKQLPENPSVSFTLSQSISKMNIVYRTIPGKNIEVEFYLNYQHNIEFEKKILACLNNLVGFFPFLEGLRLEIESYNTFPHSAGIASSASSMSALALCLCSIEQENFQTLASDNEFYTKASFIARLCSGSACRSIYGPVVLWGSVPEIIGSSNEIAIPINPLVHPVFTSYHDTILVVDSSPKTLSSSAGHELMNTHSYAKARYNQARENLQGLLKALSSGDELAFYKIVENEAFSLHGLLFSSSPFQVLLHPNTLNIIKKLNEFRADTKHNFAITLDAGPNVHLLYPEKIKIEMLEFIDSELKPFCENEFWIDDKLADGPKKAIVN